MKFTILIFLGFCLWGCSVDDERPASYFSVNESSYELPLGFIEDDGTDNDISYRKYDVMLCNLKENPNDFLMFTILSNSTTRLEEGVYSYSYSSTKGIFTRPYVGFGVAYDESAVAIRGTRISSWSMSDIEGTITVDQEDGDYKFEFDLKFTYNDKQYSISGTYWDALTSSYVYIPY